MIKHKNKKINKFISIFGVTFLISNFIFILTSCSSSISQSTTTNYVSKNNGDLFSENLSLKSTVESSLLSETGQNSTLSYYAGKLAYSWFQKVASQQNQIQYTNLLNDEIDAVNKEYTDLQDSYKKTYGDSWPSYFQREILDLNGGTETSWKQFKLYDWAKSTLISKLFEKDYLTINVGSNPINNPSKEQILTALNASKNNYNPATFGTVDNVVDGFIFSEKAIVASPNTYTDPIYAKFNQYIFDKWAQIQAPFIINMCLWKYGTPVGGIEQLYAAAPTSTSSPDGTTTTATAGTYPFPYFNDVPTNDNPDGGLTKFINFVNGSTSKANYYEDTSTGLKDIPISLTDDSSTYILAKNNSIYNDLYPEFAAASTYLYGVSTKKLSVDTNISKTVSSTSSSSYDPITANFVSDSSILSSKEIKLSSTLMSKIINNLGPLKSMIKDTYVIDAFQASNSSLNDFMFLRNQAGVHAIAIDGNKYISTATSFEQGKYYAANVVLYRYLVGSKFSSSTSFNSLNIKSELSNFFSSYSDYLILDYALNNANQTFFDINNQLGVNEQDFLKVLLNFFIQNKTYSTKKEYENKMYETKSTYAKNYGENTKNNGLAAPWIFNGTKLGGDGAFSYLLTSVVETTNPYTSSTYQTYKTAITTFIDSLNILPLSSSFSGFSSSQYIYSNNELINKVLLDIGNDNTIANLVKKNIFQQYLGSDLNLSDLTFTDTIAPYLTTPSTSLNQSTTNLYFSNTFNSASNKWYGLSTADSNNLTNQEISSFIKNVWNQSMVQPNNTNLDSYVNFLTFSACLKYLLSNNAQKFLEYLKEKVVFGNDTYLMWLNTQNSDLNLNKFSDQTTALQSIKINQNNDFRSVYTNQAPDSSIAVNLNNNYNGYYDNSNSKYFNYVENKNGFLGLQSETTNQLPQVIQQRLWTNPKLNDVNGLMYSYSSWEDLKTYINNLAFPGDVEKLAQSIEAKTKGIQTSEIYDKTKTLTEKKQALKTQIDLLQSSSISLNYFTQLNGLISPSNFVVDTTNNFLQYSTYAKQINFKDVQDVTSLISKIGADCFLNLAVSAAMDSEVQSNIISLISYNHKVNVYDLRLNDQLGSEWTKNWIAKK